MVHVVLPPIYCTYGRDFSLKQHRTKIFFFECVVLIPRDLHSVDGRSLGPGCALHYVLVDLQGDKSTTIILQGLQDGYPNATTEV